MKYSPRSPRAKSPSSPQTDESPEAASEDRLQKVLSAAGIGSRRHCEEMILAGRVEINGQTVTELGIKVDPARQKIVVDGEALRRTKLVYYLVNKPEGVLSTNYDPGGRPRVIDLLPEISGHLFTVGRLDQSSEGLILVTNDGDLANRLTHPRYGVAKTYQALVVGEFTQGEATVLTKGVRLAEGWAKAQEVKIRSQRGKCTLLEIVLSEGRNREIRRLLARVGHKVLKLKRVAIASIRLGDLAVGEFRRLRTDEVETLRKAARAGRSQRKPALAAAAECTPRPKPRSKPARAGERSSTGKRGSSRTPRGPGGEPRQQQGAKRQPGAKRPPRGKGRRP